MRIVFVVGGFPELSETFILDQMTGLLDRGHDLTILARPPSSSAAGEHATVREYRLMERVRVWDRLRGPRQEARTQTVALLRSHPIRTAGDLSRVVAGFRPGDNLLRFWSRVTTLRTTPAPDLLFAQFGPNGVLAERARAVCGMTVPLVVTFLGHDLSRLLQRRSPGYYRRLFAHGDLMLPLSRHFQDRLVAIGCPPSKIRVQHLGVDAARFAFRARTPRPGQPKRILSVARLVEKKGLATGLEAFARVRREAPDVSWHIVGDGPLRGELESLRTSLGLTDHIVFHGAMPRERVREQLDQADLFLAPSVTAADGDQEGTPVAIMEAMAVGLPVVSTLHSGIPEVVRDGITGLLVPERDPEALAAAVGQLVLHPERWGDLGRAGRAVIEREYDTRILGDRLAEILEGVRHRPPCPS